MKIGIFDSGIGGLTVLHEALNQLPQHDYLYYADTKHAPYGPKPKEEVRSYIFDAIDFLVRQGVEIVVIACNTATMVAVEDLRSSYKIPIVGIEPAIKPAIESVKKTGKRVLVTATPLTLKEERIQQLIQQSKGNEVTDLLPLPELVCFAEAFDFSSDEVLTYLNQQVADAPLSAYGAVVLGCTHFLLFKSCFRKIFGSEVLLIDGSTGVVKQLTTMIHQKQVRLTGETSLTFYQSGQEVVEAGVLERFYQVLKQLE